MQCEVMVMAVGRIRARAVAVILSISVFFLAMSAAAYPAEHDRSIDRHLSQGTDALAAGDLPTAIQHYEKCLALDPNQRYCCVNLASALVDVNDAETDDAVAQRRATQAVALLRRVLAQHPADGDAAFNLGILLQDSSRAEESTREAADLYQIAVEAADADGGGGNWDALANMAAARQELGEFLGQYGALRSYSRATVLLEGVAEEHDATLDRMLSDSGAAEREYDDKVYRETQAQLTQVNAYLSKLYYGYGTILSELPPSDCLTFVKGSSLFVGDGNEGKDEMLAKTVCDSKALTSMQRAVDLDGNNAVAIHMLAAMTGGEDSGRASNEFVTSLFDDFAETFDEKLGALGYKVPKLVGEAAFDQLQSVDKDTFRSALDAGCGTGLAGRYLRPLVGGPLVGVDLSTKMLELAAQCTLLAGCGAEKKEATDGGDIEKDERARTPLYDALLSLDLETATVDELMPRGSSDGFDLVVAADVLVYFGSLSTLLTNFRRLSHKGDDEKSFLIFSCERLDNDTASSAGWQLQSSGRYAHSKAYVTNVAESAGFDLLGYEEIVPRMERGKEVKGHLFVFATGGSIEEHVHVDMKTVMEEL